MKTLANFLHRWVVIFERRDVVNIPFAFSISMILPRHTLGKLIFNVLPEVGDGTAEIFNGCFGLGRF
jgi:hypothetical protein